MKILKRCFSLVLIAALTMPHNSSLAQDSWSLERCIMYAIEHNIQVKQQQVLVEQNENVLSQSKYNLIPSLSTGGSYSMNWGRVYDQTSLSIVEGPRQESANASLSASTVLFAGLQKQNIIKRNRIELQASIHNVEKLKNDISLNVAAVYLQVLLSQESVSIAEEQVASTGKLVERTQKLVNAGKITLSELLNLQAQQASEEAAVVNAKNTLEIDYLTLKQLLELPGDVDFKIVKPQLAELPSELNESSLPESIYDNALTFLPVIKVAELNLESAKKTLALARGRYYPTLSMNGSISSGYSNTLMDPASGGQSAYPFWDQLKNNQYRAISLNLSIPIFSGLQVRTEVKNAKLNIRNSELELQRTKNTLYKEIQQAQADVNGQLKNYHSTRRNVEAMQESLRYTEKKLEVNAVTTTDYVVAKNNLFKAQSDNIQAKYRYFFKTKILDFYKGLPIGF